MLDPDNQFHVDRQLTKEDVQKLIKLCVDRLLDVRSPSLDTVKMQVYFDMNYTTRCKLNSVFLLNQIYEIIQNCNNLISRVLRGTSSRVGVTFATSYSRNHRL